MLGPPSPPIPGTDHLSAPFAVSEYSLPLEPTTATLPSGATAGEWRMYWPATSKRHLTSPGEATAARGAKNAPSKANRTMPRKNGVRRMPTLSCKPSSPDSAISTDLIARADS